MIASELVDWFIRKGGQANPVVCLTPEELGKVFVELQKLVVIERKYERIKTEVYS